MVFNNGPAIQSIPICTALYATPVLLLIISLGFTTSSKRTASSKSLPISTAGNHGINCGCSKNTFMYLSLSVLKLSGNLK